MSASTPAKASAKTSAELPTTMSGALVDQSSAISTFVSATSSRLGQKVSAEMSSAAKLQGSLSGPPPFKSKVPHNTPTWKRPTLLLTERVTHYVDTGDRGPLQTYQEYRESSKHFNPLFGLPQSEANVQDLAKIAEGMDQIHKIIDEGVENAMKLARTYIGDVTRLNSNPALEEIGVFGDHMSTLKRFLNIDIKGTLEKTNEDTLRTISVIPEVFRDAAAETSVEGMLQMAHLIDAIVIQTAQDNRKIWNYLQGDQSGALTSGKVIGTVVKGARSSLQKIFDDPAKLVKSVVENTRELWQQKFFETMIAGWDDAVADIQSKYEAATTPSKARTMISSAAASQTSRQVDHRVIRLQPNGGDAVLNKDDAKRAVSEANKAANDQLKRTLAIFAEIKKGFEEITNKTFDTFWVEDPSLHIAKELSPGPGPIAIPLGQGLNHLGSSDIGIHIPLESGKQVQIYHPAVIGLGPNGYSQNTELGHEYKEFGHAWLNHVIGDFGKPFDQSTLWRLLDQGDDNRSPGVVMGTAQAPKDNELPNGKDPKKP